MKKIKKFLIFALIAVVVVVVIVAVGIGANLGKIVKTAIETGCPQDHANPRSPSIMSAFPSWSGAASIKGLVVGNPTGYQTTNAISMDTAAVSLAPASGFVVGQDCH